MTRTGLGLPVLGSGDWSAIDGVDEAVVAALAETYRAAVPFPHLVLDGLFDPALLHAIQASFTELPAHSWGTSSHPLQRKHGTVSDTAMPAPAQHYFDQLHGPAMLHFLSRVTGVDGLHPDPSLRFAGMHEVPDGGRFELHVDFAHHPQTRRRNRFVVITYLNEGWQPDFGGGLELWHWKPRARAATVLPVFGRTIVLGVGPTHVHGHPDPVAAPDGRARRSIAAYFYTDPDPGAADDGQARPGRDLTGYVDRPGAGLPLRALRLLHAATPGLIADQARRVLGRRQPD